MNKIQHIIYQDYISRIFVNHDKNGLSWQEPSFDDFCKMMFNVTGSNKPGLKLTSSGFTVAKTMYQTWKFSLPENWFQIIEKPKIILGLNKGCRGPYFYDRHNLYVFHSEVAMEMEMANRDLEYWVELFVK
jgi:hypothetical protein